MKKSKKLLLELTNLPVVRKKLIPESEGEKFENLEPGDIVVIPSKGNQKYIITGVSTFGGYFHCVPFTQLKQFSKTDAAGMKVAKEGIGSWKPVEV